MRKETLIKLFVVAVVLAFVIEIVAVPFLGGGRVENENGGARQPVSGTVQAEAEIVAFEPALVVSGRSGAVNATLRSLKERKLITFVTPAPGDENTMLVNLASPSAMRNVSDELRLLNLSVFVTAKLALPERIDLVTQAGEQVGIDGASFDAQLAPEFEVGDKLVISFNAEAYFDSTGRGYLARYGNLQLLPVPKSGLSANASVREIQSAVYVLSFPWEQRGLNMSGVDARLGKPQGKPSYRYVQKSFVLVNASEAELAAFGKKNLPYVTQIAGDTISIKPSFTNRSELAGQLGALAARADFPDSELMVEYNLTNESVGREEAEIGKLAEELGAAKVGYSERLALALPGAAADADGKNYTIPKNSAAFITAEGKHSVNETIAIMFDAGLSGNRVMQIGSVRTAGN